MQRKMPFTKGLVSSRRARAEAARNPCRVCRGWGRVKFDSSAIRDLMRKQDIDVIDVVGEAIAVCPLCLGDGIQPDE